MPLPGAEATDIARPQNDVSVDGRSGGDWGIRRAKKTGMREG